MKRCVIAILFAALLLPGCARNRYDVSKPPALAAPRSAHKRYLLQSPATLPPTSGSFQQYTATDFDWRSVQRILVMPFGNRSNDARIPDQLRTALTAELQQAGRFEIVLAPLDVEATGSQEVFDRGQFDEAETLHLSRRFQAQGILYGLVTEYRSYTPPMLGMSLLLVSPAEAVVVASMNGLWDARDQATVALAANYYHSTQTFPLSLLGVDRVLDSPDAYRRFVCHQVAQSLATVSAPTVPPGKHDHGDPPAERRLAALTTPNEERAERRGPRVGPGEELPPFTRKTPAETPKRPPHAMGTALSPGPKQDVAGVPARYASTSAQPPEPADTHVTHIFLNPRLTGAYNFDSHPGDDGIRLALEPRNADGHFVPRSGAVSIVASEPAEKGGAAWVARWDLEPSQLAALVRTSAVLGQGFHLKLLWPGEPPRHSELLLVVRYVDEDGRELETERKILVDPPPSRSVKEPLARTRATAFPVPIPQSENGHAKGAVAATTTGCEIELSPSPREPEPTPLSILPRSSQSPVWNDPQTLGDAAFPPAAQFLRSSLYDAGTGVFPAVCEQDLLPSKRDTGAVPLDSLRQPFENPVSSHPQTLPDPVLRPAPRPAGSSQANADNTASSAGRKADTSQPPRDNGSLPVNPVRRPSENPPAISPQTPRNPALPPPPRPAGSSQATGGSAPLSAGPKTEVTRPSRDDESLAPSPLRRSFNPLRPPSGNPAPSFAQTPRDPVVPPLDRPAASPPPNGSSTPLPAGPKTEAVQASRDNESISPSPLRRSLNPLRPPSGNPAPSSAQTPRDPVVPPLKRLATSPLPDGGIAPLSAGSKAGVAQPPDGNESNSIRPPGSPARLKPIKARRLQPVESKLGAKPAATPLRKTSLSGDSTGDQMAPDGPRKSESARETKPPENSLPKRQLTESPSETRAEPAIPVSRDQWQMFKPNYPRLDAPEFNTPARRMLDLGEPGKVGCTRSGTAELAQSASSGRTSRQIGEHVFGIVRGLVVSPG